MKKKSGTIRTLAFQCARYFCLFGAATIPALSSAAEALAVDVAYRVPVGPEQADCARVVPGGQWRVQVAPSCGGDPELSAVRNEALKTKVLVEKCREQPNADGCRAAEGFAFGERRSKFGPSLFDGQMSENCFPKQTWAPLSLVKEWQEEFAEYLKFAASGDIMNNRFLVAEAIRNDAAEQHLVTCEVTVIDGLSGPPRECHAAAVIAGPEVYIRVQPLEAFIQCFASALIRPSGAIEFRFEISNATDVTPFSEKINHLLKQDFKFATEYKLYNSSNGAVESVEIIATSGIRNTMFLEPGYREAMDVEVSLRPEGNVLKVRASTQPMVSRTNTGKIRDLRGPDDNERQRYLEVIDAKLADALMGGCSNAQKIDSLTIRCQ